MEKKKNKNSDNDSKATFLKTLPVALPLPFAQVALDNPELAGEGASVHHTGQHCHLVPTFVPGATPWTSQTYTLKSNLGLRWAFCLAQGGCNSSGEPVDVTAA